jgi:hypothetical protein
MPSCQHGSPGRHRKIISLLKNKNNINKNNISIKNKNNILYYFSVPGRIVSGWRPTCPPIIHFNFIS